MKTNSPPDVILHSGRINPETKFPKLSFPPKRRRMDEGMLQQIFFETRKARGVVFGRLIPWPMLLR